MSGFPKRKESACDAFDTGHSSTSISAGLGYVCARDLQKEDYSVISVIGDGSLTGGMAYEALNNASRLKKNFIIVLNDNHMSISENVGGMSDYLAKLRTADFYTDLKKGVTNMLHNLPVVGDPMIEHIRKTKSSLKQLIVPGMFFEDMGITYLGPIQGHSIPMLVRALKEARKIEGPVLLHVLTKKGKGYEIAEKNPDKFHATSPFDIETGKSKKEKSKDYSKVFGEKLIELAENNDKIVAITASMKDGTGLTEFQKKFPKRFFDIGIAEQHAVGLAAGMAKAGMIPVVPIYSSFYQRAYDQVIHDVAIQNLHVVMCVDRAGVVGADGETHQGVFDMAFFRLVPNLTIMAPKNFKELENMLELAVSMDSPVVIRYPRGGEDKQPLEDVKPLEIGKAEILKSGKDITIVAIGKMVAKAMKVADILSKENIQAEVINARFLKPLDKETIISSLLKTKNLITIEDGTIIGGLASAVNEIIVSRMDLRNVNLKNYAYPDMYIQHGSVEELEKIYGLDIESIVKGAKDILKDILERKLI